MSNDRKHTPGPPLDALAEAHAANQRRAARRAGARALAENPALYEAAPDLLAALRVFLALWPGIEHGHPAHPDVVMACNRARAAIAKAEGR